jgi:lipopolysaccharide/colanic/teichoic acid biosynthesis glycosyltransferase
MYQHFFKRLFDIIGSLIILPFVLLEIIILAPIIWLTDKGPVFYNANRAGKNYKPFKMFKLRSMYVNSPDLKNADGSTYNSDDDPRVTPIGRIMRKTSLDEFPQFLNILLGDMSFVGPRPKLYKEGRLDHEKDENIIKSFKVKPGVTGYAQAYFRNSITQDEKFKWDAYYADNLTMWMDIKILFQTVWSVVARKNINTEQSYSKL